LVEDKWNRTKTKAVEVDKDDMELNIKLDVDENGIPWWAKVLDQKKFKSWLIKRNSSHNSFYLR
jgi:hypothetical protein